MKTKITPGRNHIFVIPQDEDMTPGGIALPQVSKDSAEGMKPWRGYVHSYSYMAWKQMEESLGRDLISQFDEGCEVVYFGHTSYTIDGVEFHIIKPVDVWCILEEVDG